MFIPSIIKSIQSVEATIVAFQTSVAQNLGSNVTAVNSIVIPQGQRFTGNDLGFLSRASSLSNTQLTVERGQSQIESTVYRALVLEFYRGFLIQDVQFGTITIAAGVFTADYTITSVGSKAQPICLGWTGPNATTFGALLGTINKTSATNIRAERNIADASNALTVSFCIADFR